MDPEDIHKGRVCTWAVLIIECLIALVVMMWMINVDRPNIDREMVEKTRVVDPQMATMIEMEHKSADKAASTANVVGPVYFVVLTAFSLAVLGGSWGVRVAYGVFLAILALLTLLAPWLSPHRIVLTDSTLHIIMAVVFSLLHLAGAAIILLLKPVRLFLHPRRMLFTHPPS